ncbi:MAG: hypothetical protein A2163_04055 [Actinobacteria bacterium RBG_13_35_12]|nr:MAG: hypothetical protein A2163_04055 [Actinobacteria bacterium RBG_13_35_12]
MGDLIRINFKTAERIQDLNCDALASIVRENKLLHAIDEVLYHLDRRDGVLGNEPKLNHAIKILDEAKKQNTYQYRKDNQEKTILDEIVPLFSEHIPDEAA